MVVDVVVDFDEIADSVVVEVGIYKKTEPEGMYWANVGCD